MLTKKRYGTKDVLIWTRIELLFFTLYSFAITFAYTELEVTFLHVPWTPLALIGTAVAFLIGFQNNAAYERAWEARKIWGGIVNISRSFSMKVVDNVRDPESGETTESLKETHKTIIYRHIAWLTALRHAMREHRPWEDISSHKTSKEWNNKIYIPEREESLQRVLNQYLSIDELEYVLSKGNKPSTILFLQSKHLRKLKEKKFIWEFAFLMLEQTIEELFNLQGKSERIKNFPYPRQYATICFLFIWMFLLLLPFGIVPEFQRIAGLFEASNFIKDNFVWIAVPFCAAVSWVFHTMERIGRVGENPFEGSPNDVPISNIARAIEIDIRQQLNEKSATLPKQFRADHSVQM